MSKYDFKSKDRKTGEVKNCGYMKLDSYTEYAELHFYGDICSDKWSTWTSDDKCPQDIADFFSELEDSKRPLNVYVNSGGGSVFGGLGIYNIISRYQGEKTAYIDGLAASIAGIIPFACDKVIAKSSSMIMLHKPWSSISGNADEMRTEAEALDICEQAIINVYKNHMVNDTTEEDIKAMIDKETWLTCDEAAKYFDIEIQEGSEAVACVSDYFSRYKNAPENLTKVKKPEETKNHESKKKSLQLQLDLLSV